MILEFFFFTEILFAYGQHNALTCENPFFHSIALPDWKIPIFADTWMQAGRQLIYLLTENGICPLAKMIYYVVVCKERSCVILYLQKTFVTLLYFISHMILLLHLFFIFMRPYIIIFF